MAQGFRRTGSTFSQKSSNNKQRSTPTAPIRKGARVIAPKRAAAQTRAKITAKLTASLNRRAESALIGRIGHEETSLKLIKADTSILQELQSKNKKKAAEAAAENAKTKEAKGPASNELIKNAINALGNEEELAESAEEEEVFTEDEAIPMSTDSETESGDVDEAEK